MIPATANTGFCRSSIVWAFGPFGAHVSCGAFDAQLVSTIAPSPRTTPLRMRGDMAFSLLTSFSAREYVRS